MKSFRFFCLIFSVYLIIAFCCSCGTVDIKNPKYKLSNKMSDESDFVIAENENFILEYFSEYASVVLKDKSGNTVWCTSSTETMKPRLDEYGDPMPLHSQIKSPIVIEYIEPITSKVSKSYAYNDCVKEGNFTVKKIKNGVTVSYYFNEVEICVPVSYILCEKGVEVSVDSSKITENENLLYSVSVAPYACAINNLSEDGYLFIPSGSGAIVEPCQLEDGSYSYSRELYGNDAERTLEQGIDVDVFPENRLAVIGAKYDNYSAVCGIINNGAEQAFIEANIGAANIGFGSVWTKFALRGYQWSKERKNQQVKLFSNSMNQNKVSVLFVPIFSQEKSNYIGMAECYRNYLIENHRMKSDISSSALTLKIIGGANATENILGFSFDKFFAATTLSQANDIVSDIVDKTGVKPNVDLVGFGNDGIDIKTVSGNYTVNNSLGGEKGMKSFSSFAKENNINLFVNYNVIAASKSGGGISKFSDMALSQDKRKVKQYYYNIYSRLKSGKQKSYLLIARDEIFNVCKKLSSKCKEQNIYGIALDTLSSVCYSDYSSVEYFNKGNTALDVTKIFNEFNKDKFIIAVNEANDYAAAESDLIIDAPLFSSQNNIFSYDVPFYSIVFKGNVELCGQSVNLSADEQEAVLRAAEVGAGLTFTVIGQSSTKLFDSFSPFFYGSVYSGISDNIVHLTNEYKKTFVSVASSQILDHKVFDNGVRKTVFDNGTVIYVNYSNSEQEINGLKVSPRSYFAAKE